MTGLLQKAIAEQTGKRAEVVCAGVGAWGPNHYLRQSQVKLAAAAFHLQLVFLYLENDIEKAKVDHYPPHHLAPYHDLRLPRQLTSEEIINAFLYPINDWLEVRSHAFILFRNRMQPLLARLGLTAGSIPNVLYRANAGKPWWDITADICQEIAGTGEHYGIPTLFILLPPSFSFIDAPLRELGYDSKTMDLLQPYRLMKPRLEARDLKLVDLMPAFKARSREGVSCYGEVDTHFNAEGHRLAAEVILPAVIAALEQSRAGEGTF